MLLLYTFSPQVSAEIYEVIEDGQVYLVEVEEEVVEAAKKKKTPDELNDSISEKMETINKRMNRIADLAYENLDMSKKHKTRLKNELKRADKANKRAKKDKSFKDTGKRKKISLIRFKLTFMQQIPPMKRTSTTQILTHLATSKRCSTILTKH